jgi:hypothetical protein
VLAAVLAAVLGSAQVVAHNLNGFAQLLYQAAVGIPVILTGLACKLL